MVWMLGTGVLATLSCAAARAATANDASSSDTSMSEIIVTANKLKAQSVLDAPVSIQAISGDALQAAGSSAIMDVAGQIPGLSIQDLGPGDKKYVIRGINSSGDSTTGVYYGEATISGSNANDGGGFEPDIRLFDLDHIEVLRGPQGTLYGASSMSGTIRFIPKSPDLNSIGGYLTAEGSYTDHGSSNSNVNGALNLPVIDGVLAVRLVGWHVNDSGFINQNRIGSGLPLTAPTSFEHVNNDYVEGGRVMVRYKPTDDFTLDLNYTGQTETSNGSSRFTPAGVTAWSAPGVIPPVQGCDYCNTDVTRSPWSDDLKVFGFTATEKTSFGTITATSNQFNRVVHFSFDSTPILVFYGFPVPAETLEPQSRDVNSSEIRFASDFGGPVNFVSGVYRQHEANWWAVQVISTNSVGDPIGTFSSSNSQDAIANPTGGDTWFGSTDHRETTQYAGFTEVTWKPIEKLSVVGGIRYFTERLTGVQVQTHPFGGFPGSPNLVPIYDPTETFNKITWKVNVSYKVDDGFLPYATVSTGFRSGGLNPQQEPFEPIPGAFSPDTLTNYEVGAKGRLFDGAVDYQADVYLIRWNNIQVLETTSDGAFNYIGNAGNAKVKGFEFELETHPFQYFSTSLAGSYQDAYLTDGATPGMFAANPTLGLTGQDIPNVPKLQLDLGLNYTRPVYNQWAGTLAADLVYRDAENSYFQSNIYNVPLAPYTLVNLRAGISEGPWTVTAFVRNLTDKIAEVSAINSIQDKDSLLTVRPRTVGLTVTRKF
jgi:outer membrane receptor protein involved in Fe transport